MPLVQRPLQHYTSKIEVWGFLRQAMAARSFFAAAEATETSPFLLPNLTVAAFLSVLEI
jgi:hypothetical protein